MQTRNTIPLITPLELQARVPLTSQAAGTVERSRESIRRILRRQDNRLLVIVGPCSIHDSKAAREYASRLNNLQAELTNLLVVMRVYFEKPRTTTGWKGLINDPRLDGSQDIAAGLAMARQILIDINELGLAAATEWLDPIVPQYLAELIAWAAIGARTTESQTHREMASGLSMPVGFKNSTGGSLENLANSLLAALSPHSFLGIDYDGRVSSVSTPGNPDVMAVLRGDDNGPNFSRECIEKLVAAIRRHGIDPRIIIDSNHNNSGKKHERQPEVCFAAVRSRLDGCAEVLGLMIESHLYPGKQPFPQDEELKYGVSITDACLGWDETEQLLRDINKMFNQLERGSANSDP